MPLLESQSDVSALSGLQEGESIRHVGRASTEGTGWKTVFESESYSIAVDHMREDSKLFDLTKDSGKKSNVWGDSKYRKVRFDLLKKCFDATVFAIRQEIECMG
jgi:hypothetical protein